jgi:hypothetical protein
MKSMSWRARCGIAAFVAIASSAHAEPHPKLARPAHEPAAHAPEAQAPPKIGVPRGDLRGDIASNVRTHGDPPRPPAVNRPPKP